MLSWKEGTTTTIWGLTFTPSVKASVDGNKRGLRFSLTRVSTGNPRWPFIYTM